ncbi:egg cell-secreted protein 1.1-like [Abrus precatorius]|uniref:Egg cell-secreted protein 1.1-like n=1 Tax=Abrus precatorius TaxID=3816 RepID=A0A8B8KVU7_ABRPR|nr:egg cell-secreted protein 1.1-like [Abrus precatorius]
MASTHKLFIHVAFVAITAMVTSTSIVESRSLLNPSSTSPSLAIRLKVEGEPSNCWDSLWQLQACSGEIITFFLNGETYLSHGCCHAIRVIGHDCWPNIVGSLGFTNEETDILEGYCDEVAFHSPPPPAPQSLVEPKELVP